MAVPHSVIHFDFPGGSYLFDARHVWNALKRKEATNSHFSLVPKQFGPMALSIATKGVLMGLALGKLKTALAELYACPEVVQATHTIRGEKTERMKQNILLYTDATLFEFRSYLDLIANFTYGILAAIGKPPATSQLLSSGLVTTLLDKNDKLRRYDCGSGVLAAG